MTSSVFQKSILYIAAFCGLALTWWLWTSHAEAANFSITPSGGTYAVGTTFDVSVIVDTKGQEINAVQVNLAFPADKLQLVSPSTGSSIISIYTTPPKYDNATGRIEIIGGIPNGINVSSGLITKLTFRVKGIGTAALRFNGESQVLLNDGRGTNVLDNTFGASFKLELPPQQGPIVISDTHPDQESWYRNSNVNLQWDVGLPPADNYSYSISDNPSDVPDDTPETNNTSVSYKSVPDGINYFHIKAFRNGRWGGVSHYGLKIDNSPPAEFQIEINPSARTNLTKPIINFATTDTLSGLDRYEIKILPLKINGRSKAVSDEQLFVDATSPYQTNDLLHGTYQVILRSYDKAGNMREVTKKLEITDSMFWFLGQDGVWLPFGKQVSWSVAFWLLLLLILAATVLAYYMRRWYRVAHSRVENNHLPDSVAKQLAELNQYRQKYGKIAAVFILGVIMSSVVGLQCAQAQTPVEVTPTQSAPTQTTTTAPATDVQTPPVITSFSANIKDDELFYVSGRTTEPNSQVVVHVQSMVDGSAFDFTTSSDKRGDWIYRHNDFLAGGKYSIWAHTKIGDQLSSPSPQVEMDVKPVAINWGNSRITYQSIYIGVIVSLFLLLMVLLVYIVVHALLVRHRRKIFGDKLRQTEDSLKRGFIALRRDIEAELLLIRQAHLNTELSGEQRVREEQLKTDLKSIEDLVGKEMWEVETFEQLPHNS